MKEITVTLKDQFTMLNDQCITEREYFISITTTTVDTMEMILYGESYDSRVNFPVIILKDGERELYAHDFEERDFSSQNIVYAYESELWSITIKVNGINIVEKHSLAPSLSLSSQLKGKTFEYGNYRILLQ